MNKYEIIKDIGVGTYGTVYEAINKTTSEKVAIKKLRQKIDSWEQCMNQNEVYFLRKLNHPNIVKLLEVIREKNNDISLVFEYCDCNLYELIKSHKRKQIPISESQIKNIIYSITSGLSHMHSNGIMHRDLKPENILIRGNEIKIADFGTAKEIPKYNSYNDIDSMTDYICTRWYRAPELVLKSKNYNEKVDIWALGCIMAELYNLRPLYPGQSEFDQIDKIFKVLGTPKNGDWIIGFDLMEKLGMRPNQYNGVNLRQLFSDISQEALNFMELIFQYDDNKRPSAEELLNHPYLKNYNNNDNENIGYNKVNNIYRKFNRNFSNSSVPWKNDFINYFNLGNNNNYKEKSPRNLILPEIKRNNIDNYFNSGYNLRYNRNNSYLVKRNQLYTHKNKQIYFGNNYFSNNYRNKLSEEHNNNSNSNSFIYPNYLKINKKPILSNDDFSKEQTNINQYSTMSNNDIIQKKNFFFDKYEYKTNVRESINYGDNSFPSLIPKTKKFQKNYYLKDKFKNFGYNYFPDGNYRSIFSIK